MGRSRDAFSLARLQERCAHLREHLLRAKLVTEADLAPFVPGGEDNPYSGREGWIWYWAQLIRFTDRVGQKDETTAAELAEARREAMRGLRESPVTVELVAVDDAGAPRTLAVHPKGFDALCVVDEIDLGIRWLIALAERLEGSGTAEAVLRRQECYRAVSELHQVCAWIACTKGPGLPFDPTQPHPPAPADFAALDAYDLLSIMSAFHRVNRSRFSAVSKLLRKSGGGEDEPASWETLAAAVAADQRCPIEHLLRDRSLVAWLSQAALTWDARATAQQQAEAGAGV